MFKGKFLLWTHFAKTLLYGDGSKAYGNMEGKKSSSKVNGFSYSSNGKAEGPG